MLSNRKVKFLLVGAYAMAAHGYPRSTMDIDLWVMPSPENASFVFQALKDFGAPCNNITPEDLQKDELIFQIGVEPRRIDIITSVDGLKFEDAYNRSKIIEIDNIPIHVISISDLITNKKASGRPKDLLDAETLEKLT
jgi:hypothetical protein